MKATPAQISESWFAQQTSGNLYMRTRLPFGIIKLNNLPIPGTVFVKGYELKSVTESARPVFGLKVGDIKQIGCIIEATEFENLKDQLVKL